jgi:hypothetical protein
MLEFQRLARRQHRTDKQLLYRIAHKKLLTLLRVSFDHRDELLVFAAEGLAIKKIRTIAQGFFERLPASPAADLLVISR